MFEKKIKLALDGTIVLLNFLDIDYKKIFEELNTTNSPDLESSIKEGIYYVVPQDSGITFHLELIYHVSNTNPNVLGKKIVMERVHSVSKFVPFKK